MKIRLDTDYIVIHCSATPPGMDIGADDIRRWHTDKPPAGRGWKDIAYAEVIRRNGVSEEGRDLDPAIPAANEIGAHVLGYNDKSIGICLVGGVGENGDPENNFTPVQMLSLKRSLKFYKALFPEAEIVGHRDLDPGKACPSFDVGAWLKSQNLFG